MSLQNDGFILGTDGSHTIKTGDMALHGDGCLDVSLGNGMTVVSGDGHSGVRMDIAAGGMSLLSGGKTAVKLGPNMWSGPKGTYMLVGSMLTGPGGKTWMNVSEKDVMSLIDHDS